MKVISFSLFGYNKEKQENCFDFDSYLRGFMLNVRLIHLLYPNFIIYLYVDRETYEGFKEFFDNFNKIGKVFIEDGTELTRAMLWRMKPCFDEKVEVVICRDLDSPVTYREVQAVTQWINSPKAAHAITDSVSHNIPMLGGMVGFKPMHFKRYTGFNTWEEMVDGKGIDYKVKGADQDLLNRYVYPKFAKVGGDSIMQHYFLGMRNTFLDGYLTCDCRVNDETYHKFNCPLNIELNIPEEYDITNHFAGHIGAAGWYEPPMFKFFYKHLDRFTMIREVEQPIASILNWKI